MRKVLYKKWIPVEWEIDEHLKRKSKAGTNCWEPDFTHEGIFHQWGNSYEEFDIGPGNFTVGLIENPDGTISEILPMNIKFVNE